MDNLTRKSLIGLVQLQVVMVLLLFLPAGSLSFWRGWVYWILFSLCVIAITLYFLKYDPHLIEGRLAAGPGAEQETSQKIIQAIAAVLFFAVLIVPGLDYRFHWSQVPTAIVVVGDFLLVLSLAMIFFVFRENSYAAGTIRVEAEQRVISTGPLPAGSTSDVLGSANPVPSHTARPGLGLGSDRNASADRGIDCTPYGRRALPIHTSVRLRCLPPAG